MIDKINAAFHSIINKHFFSVPIDRKELTNRENCFRVILACDYTRGEYELKTYPLNIFLSRARTY
jgi:hypothetical protein